MVFRILGWALACVVLTATLEVQEGLALQRHTLLPEQSAEQQASGVGNVQPQTPLATSQASGDFHGVPATQTTAPDAGHGGAVPAPQGSPGVAKEQDSHGGQAGVPGAVAQPGSEPAHDETHGEHGPALPQISPTPGVTFVETMIHLMEYELNDRFLGWRPNDIIVGRFTDNVNYFQLGVLEAIRFTTLRLKDSLTRMGDADTYDPDLELAVNLFMNRSTLFWFPSAETSYGEGIQHLKSFITKLNGGQRNFYYRVDNLRLLLASYKDLLGNVNRSLIVSPVSMFKTDDYFYYAKGIAHVYYEILRVVRVGYEKQLASTMNGIELMDEIIHELHRVEELDPWIILDSDLDGFFANHRANLNAPLSEVMHLLGILSTF
jgi:hypothetical protein